MNTDSSSIMHAHEATVLTKASMVVCCKILSAMYTGVPGVMQTL